MNTQNIIKEAGNKYRINEIIQKASKYSEVYFRRPISICETKRLCAILCGYSPEQIAEMEGISVNSSRVFASTKIKELLLSVLDDDNIPENISRKKLLELLNKSQYRLIDLYEFDNEAQNINELNCLSKNLDYGIYKNAISIRENLESKINYPSIKEISNEELDKIEAHAKLSKKGRFYAESIDSWYRLFTLNPSAYGCLIQIGYCYDELGMTNDVLLISDFCIHLLKTNIKNIKKEKGELKYERWMTQSLNLIAGHYYDKGEFLNSLKYLHFAIKIYNNALEYQPLDLIISWNIVQCSIKISNLLYGSPEYEISRLKFLSYKSNFIGRLQEKECAVRPSVWKKIKDDIKLEIKINSEMYNGRWVSYLQNLLTFQPSFIN